VALHELEVERKRRRLFVAGVIAGAVAALVIGALGLMLFLRGIRSYAVDHLTELQTKYQAQYDSCVNSGTSAASCSERVANACIDDPYFAHDENATSDISSVCLVFDD
jgi:hypothetical protein